MLQLKVKKEGCKKLQRYIRHYSCLKEEEDVCEDDEEVEGEPRDGEDEADERQDEGHAPVPLQLALAPPLVRLKARVLPAIKEGKK